MADGLTSVSASTVPRLGPLARWLVISLIVGLSVWLLSPIVTSTHTEAFSARLESQAIQDSRGSIALDDQTYPINTEYLYGTRPGLVQSLEWMMRLAGPGDTSFRLLVMLSYCVFLAASVSFARQWGSVPSWASLLFVVFTPGLVEISFFFADNLPSAAAACLALALVGKSTPRLRWFVIGALVATAVLVRLDALLIVPSILLVSLSQHSGSRARLALGWLIMTAGCISLFLLSGRLLHVGLLQSVAIGRWSAGIHLSEVDPVTVASVALTCFFGYPSLILLRLGASNRLPGGGSLWHVAFAIYPCLFYLLFTLKAVELRDFLLLGAPFLVLHGGRGILRLQEDLNSPAVKKRIDGYGVLAISLLIIALPPLIVVRDGPRTVTGRLWSPVLWRHWQQGTMDSLSRCDRLINSARPGDRIVIVSTMYNADAYLHLRLLQAGYGVLPASPLSPYGNIAEVYSKGSVRFIEVRTENPYTLLSRPPLSLPFDYVQDFQLHAGLQSVAQLSYNRAYLLTWGNEREQPFVASTKSFQRGGAMELEPTRVGVVAPFNSVHFGLLRTIELSPEDVSDLLAISSRGLRTVEAAPHPSWKDLESYDRFHSLVMFRFWNPGE